MSAPTLNVASIKGSQHNLGGTLDIAFGTIVLGDLLFASVLGTGTATWTAPSGWTALTGSVSTAWSWWKIATATEVAASNSTMHWTNNQAINQYGMSWKVDVGTFDPNNPIQSALTQTRAAAANPAGSTVTAANTNSLEIQSLVMSTAGSVPSAAPSGTTLDAAIAPIVTSGSVALAHAVVGPGSVGSATWTAPTGSTRTVTGVIVNPYPNFTVGMLLI